MNTFDTPPGEGWDLWDNSAHRPITQRPGYYLTLGRSLEVWHVAWGNKTSYVSDLLSCPDMDVTGLYWRPA